MFRNGRWISASIMLSMMIAACSPVQPQANAENFVAPESTSLDLPEQTATPWFPTPDNSREVIELSTPGGWERALSENANDLSTNGMEVHIQNGLSPEIFNAQKSLGFNMLTTFDLNGYRYDLLADFNVGSTLINMDGTDFAGYYLISTVAHVSNLGYVAPQLEDAIHEQYGSGFINYKSTTVQNINVGGVSLNKNQFGMVSFFDNYDRNYTDQTYILVPQSLIPPEMQNSALPFDRILFSAPNRDLKYSNKCNPMETGYAATAFTGGTYAGEYGNAVLIKGLLFGKNCSGTPVGATDASGINYLAGIAAGNFSNRPGNGDLGLVQPYSQVGRQGLLDLLAVAKLDLDLKNNQP